MADKAAIGVDVGGTTTKGGIVSRSGEVLTRVDLPTDRSAGTKSVISVVEDLLQQVPDLGVQVGAIGIGAAGFVEHRAGRITFSPNISYGDSQLKEAVSARVDLPVTIDNDANAAAWGEYTFGAAQGSKHLALLTLGTGIGSGFVVEGQVLRGFTGAGAEFGHTVIDPAGPQCPCGLRGCVEQFCSGLAIAREGRVAAEQDPQSSIAAFAGSLGAISAEHVGQAARQFDETARAVLRNAGTMLGVALTNLVNVFDPEVIVLAGGLIRSGEPMLGAARDELNTRLTAQRRRPTRLDVTMLGKDIGILGAAALALTETGELS